jgi:hypothetical protein
MSTVTLHLSPHAVERFHQRVRPALAVAEAEDKLARLALFGELTPHPPAWHAATAADIAPWYLVIGDVVLPLKPHWSGPDALVATTCFARGEHSEAVRRRRRAQRRRSRFAPAVA